MPLVGLPQITTPTVIPAANKVAHLYLEHQSQPNPMRLELLTVLLNHSSVQELNSNHRQLQHLGPPNPVLRLEMLVPINPTHLDQHLVLLLKQGDYLEPTQLTQQLNQVQYLDKRKMMLLPVLLERPVLDYLELIPLLTISRPALLLVLLHRPPPMKRQKNPNQLALSVPNQQIVQQVQAQQGYLLVLKTKQLVQLAVEAYLGPRKINLQHQREDYSALQQQVRMPNQQMIPPQVVN